MWKELLSARVVKEQVPTLRQPKPGEKMVQGVKGLARSAPTAEWKPCGSQLWRMAAARARHRRGITLGHESRIVCVWLACFLAGLASCEDAMFEPAQRITAQGQSTGITGASLRRFVPVSARFGLLRRSVPNVSLISKESDPAREV